MKKWLYPLLIAFVAFLIFSSPTRAGTETRTFVVWLGDLAGAAGEFLDGLFNDDVDTSTNRLLEPNQNDIDTESAPAATPEDEQTVIVPTTEVVTIDPGTGDSSDSFDQ